jgi:hypothetical protein
LPGGNFAGQHGGVGHPPIQTLAAENTQLNLGDIEPPAVLGGVVQLQLVGEALGLGLAALWVIWRLRESAGTPALRSESARATVTQA